jgi:hypothetical protein
MPRYYVSGCNRPISLLGELGFILDPITLNLGCETKALVGSFTQLEAIERCRVCKHCVVDEYLQKPPTAAPARQVDIGTFALTGLRTQEAARAASAPALQPQQRYESRLARPDEVQQLPSPSSWVAAANLAQRMMADPEFAARVEQGWKAVDEGRVTPLAEVQQRLGDVPTENAVMGIDISQFLVTVPVPAGAQVVPASAPHLAPAVTLPMPDVQTAVSPEAVDEVLAQQYVPGKYADVPQLNNVGAQAPAANWWDETQYNGTLVQVMPDERCPELLPSLDDLLPPDAPRGPSLMGNSKLRPFRKCLRRGFYEVVMGLRRPVEPERFYQGRVKLSALCLGALVHELLRQHYLGRDWEAVLPPILDHYPKLANEALRLVQQHNTSRDADDRDKWDVRFAEMESRLYLPARRVVGKGKGRGAKKISVCITARHDLGIRVKQAHEPRLPPHEKSQQIWIVDHKTIENVSRDATAAYAHDVQVLQNLVCYRDGWCETPAGWRKSAEVYGPAAGFVLNLIGKAQNHDPNAHLIRTRYTVSPTILDEFVTNTADFVYEELLPRLLGTNGAKEATWPKGYDCRDPVTSQACPYMQVCEQGGIAKVNLAAIYDPPRPLDPQALLAPEKPAARPTGRRKGKSAAAEVEAK